jgi:hypothetical protein
MRSATPRKNLCIEVSIGVHPIRSGPRESATGRFASDEEKAMPQYLLSVHYVEGQQPPAPDVVTQMHADVDAFNQKLQANGKWVFAGGLETPDVSTVVDNTGNETITTDGPFPEAKEHLGGFWVVKAGDLDEALALAAEGSKACRGPVEVRPFQDDGTEG